MRTSLLIAAAALALACQSPPTKAEGDHAAPLAAPSTQPAASAAKPQPACTAEPLQAELTGYCDFDIGIPAIELAKVPWTADIYHPLATRVITLDRQGLSDPEGEGTVSIQAWLADPPRRLPEPGEMVFAIAADVPLTAVAELQRGLFAAGRKQVRYLVHVADPRPIPQPQNPELLAGMREALPPAANERVMFVAQAVQGYAETCPPVAAVFAKLAAVAPGDRCPKLGELMAGAIAECGCTNLSEIMTLLYALTIGFEVPKGRAAAVPVVLDPQREVAPSEATTWAEFASEQLASIELHHLWIDAAPTDPDL